MSPLPSGRILTNDLIALSQSLPLFLVDKQFHVAALAEARRRATPRISWTVLLVKAYAQVAVEIPELRQAYFGWPWARLYEHPYSTAAIAVKRSEPAGDRLFFARIKDPARKPLAEIQQALDRFRTAPVSELFKTQLRLSQIRPGPIRRMLWRLAFSFSGKVRAKFFGTFGFSTLASQGIYNRIYPSCLATNLAMGPVDEHGDMPAGILFDHRIMDGMVVVRALERLQQVLSDQMHAELAGMTSTANAA